MVMPRGANFQNRNHSTIIIDDNAPTVQNHEALLKTAPNSSMPAKSELKSAKVQKNWRRSSTTSRANSIVSIAMSGGSGTNEDPPCERARRRRSRHQ